MENPMKRPSATFNRQKLADGEVKMNEIIKVAAARLMVR
jgi:hypothetical protein